MPSDTIHRTLLIDSGVTVSMLNLGAVTQSWQVPHKGAPQHVILGYHDPEAYRTGPCYFGAIAGRVANRIGKARYHHNGQDVQLVANEGVNQLHGGPNGLSTVFWDFEQPDQRSLRLSHLSPDGANGFPGAVEFELLVTLEDHKLTYDFSAKPSCETPISLAQHNYYDLSGGKGVKDMRVHASALSYLERDGEGIMTGRRFPVDGKPFDFRRPTAIGEGDPAGEGVDDFLVFDRARDPALSVVDAFDPSGLRLSLWSSEPGVQVYTAANMPLQTGGHGGQTYGAYAGVCFEPSGFPNAVNQPYFPSVMCRPDRSYHQKLTIEIRSETP